MKKILFLLASLCTAAVAGYAQIEITGEQGSPPLGQPVPYTYIKNPGTGLPQGGTGQVWDFSHFLPCDDCLDASLYLPANEQEGLPEGTYQTKTKVYTLGHITPYTIFYHQNEEGDIYQVGASFPESILSMQAVSGHPMDQLTLTAQSKQTAILEMDYPLHYGKQWATESKDTFIFYIDAPSINIKRLPLHQWSSYTTQYEIIGSGQLTLPYWEDGQKSTHTYEALLLKYDPVSRLRFTSPAIPDEELAQLLSLAGVSLESENRCEAYKFYIREHPLPVLIFRACSGRGTTERASLQTSLSQFPPFAK